METFINQLNLPNSNEKKLPKMEEERPDALEVAAQKDEEREEKKSRERQIIISLSLCLNPQGR
jgi:hypothetical protein